MATAVLNKVDVLDTFDSDLLKLDGKIGNPVLKIGNPDMGYQTTLEGLDALEEKNEE